MTITPDDPRRYAPATERNREPILKVLHRILPKQGTILEIASGTGEHAIAFAPRLPSITWQPSDPDQVNRASIQAWQSAVPSPNLRIPLAVNVEDPRWSVELHPPDPPISAMVTINLLHIAPWSASLGLMAGAGRILPSGGVLIVYGPFWQADQPVAPSNRQFDQDLRSQNAAWGIRDLQDVIASAAAQKLTLCEVVSMPANNLSLVFRHG